jgi:hypothetical protein
LRKTSASAETAYRQGNIDETSYVNLRVALINREIEVVGLEQLILEQRVAMQTLVGGELPIKSNYQGE